MDEIPDDQLTFAAIPRPDADWDEIGAFALTIDGYERAGSFEALAEIANARRRASLADLRMCLFFEQRRWRHFGDEPDEDGMQYIRELVCLIRHSVAHR